MPCMLKKVALGLTQYLEGVQAPSPPAPTPPTGTGLKRSSKRAKQEPQGRAAEQGGLSSPPAGRGTRHTSAAL